MEGRMTDNKRVGMFLDGTWNNVSDNTNVWRLESPCAPNLPNRPIGAEPLDTGDAVISTINETIDATVFDCWRSDETYRPRNLSDWATRRGVDPSTLNQLSQGRVFPTRADDVVGAFDQ
jgi:hypothetical protein